MTTVHAPLSFRQPDSTGARFLTHRGVNALAESVIGLFKTEVIQRLGPWRNLDGVEFATLSWVDWFNNRRLLEPIGYVPPAEYEATYYEQAAVA
jgi:transposase InsO family protein